MALNKKLVHSNIIIGNFLIEAVSSGRKEFNIFHLLTFDNMLSELLPPEFYTDIDISKVLDFAYDYPFFIKSIDDDIVIINYDGRSDKQKYINTLKRYFRIGMPKKVYNSMLKIFEKYS